MNKVMNGAWLFIYWANFTFGTVLKPFFQNYWLSGHFSRSSKAKFACKKLLLKVTILLVVTGALCGAGYYYLQGEFFEKAMIVLLLLSNIYGMCVLVLLVSYGLAFVPVHYWRIQDYEGKLYRLLLEAPDVN
jgi:hypothetical protein